MRKSREAMVCDENDNDSGHRAFVGEDEPHGRVFEYFLRLFIYFSRLWEAHIGAKTLPIQISLETPCRLD